nr:MAG TPA: hypothetical protein [Caudoviricetes sp.]
MSARSRTIKRTSTTEKILRRQNKPSLFCKGEKI